MAPTTHQHTPSEAAVARQLPFWLPRDAQGSLWYGLFLVLILLAVDWWAWSNDEKIEGWLPNWLLYSIIIQLMLAFVLYHFTKFVWEPLAARDDAELERLLAQKAAAGEAGPAVNPPDSGTRSSRDPKPLEDADDDPAKAARTDDDGASCKEEEH